MIILNDLHEGLRRQRGVTPASLRAYKQRQYDLLGKIVRENSQDEILILGDLFDGGLVPFEDLWRVWEILKEHPKVTLVAGNHDLTRNTEQLSAFQLLGRMLPLATVILNPTFDEATGIGIVPHCPNQNIFDAALEELKEAGAKAVLLHCNYDNHFAVTKDHSLNLSAEQASWFPQVIIAHEHNKRKVGHVEVLGAQLPTSIGDCATSKGYHRWEGPGSPLQFVETWNNSGYSEVHWRDLETATGHFIRVIGEASAEEAATVIELINKFRETSSDVFFITNSVKVGTYELGELEEVTEDMLGNFDPMEVMISILKPEYAERLRGLLP